MPNEGKREEEMNILAAYAFLYAKLVGEKLQSELSGFLGKKSNECPKKSTMEGRRKTKEASRAMIAAFVSSTRFFFFFRQSQPLHVFSMSSPSL
jgi:hypothetical protein